MTQYNPRYVCYCTAQGRSPEAQLAHDEEAYPGGHMAGFILWMSAAYQAWTAELGITKGEGVISCPRRVAILRYGYDVFDRWLVEYAARRLPVPGVS